MPQIFKPAASHLLRAGIACLILLPVGAYALVAGLSRAPYVTETDVPVPQPVPFSHLHHVQDDGLDCRYCHADTTRSSAAGMPSTKTCMTCHSQIWSDAEVLAPVRESARTGQPIRWARVHNLPDFVFFDHSVHLASGVGCTTCHGSVDRMPMTRQATTMTMQWCLSCHRDPAPHLRPPEAVFSADWMPPPARQEKHGRELMAHYGIETGRLTDCTVCHR